MFGKEFLICVVIGVVGVALAALITLGARKLRNIGKIRDLEKRREELHPLYMKDPKEYFDEVLEFNSRLRFMKKIEPKNLRLAAISEIQVLTDED